MELLDAERAGPRALRRRVERRRQAVHVVAAVAVVTEQQLVIVIARAAHGTTLALDTLPSVLPHRHYHVHGELETSGVA